MKYPDILQHLKNAIYYRIDLVSDGVWFVKTVGKLYDCHIDVVDSKAVFICVKLFCEWNNLKVMSDYDWRWFQYKEQNLFAGLGDDWQVLKIK